MERIPIEIANAFHLSDISEFKHSARDYYSTFLIQSDYVVSKAAEAQLVGEPIEPYTEVIEARRFARAMINAIDSGTYDGPEAGTNLIFVNGEDVSSGVIVDGGGNGNGLE